MEDDLNKALIRALQRRRLVDLDLIKSYLVLGADVNARDNHGRTALMLARTIEHRNFLIKAGADINATDNEGKTDLMYALEKKYKIKLIKDLIEAGADVNIADKEGSTALMYALTAQQTELLIEAGANVNVVNKDGRTALMYAESAEQTELLLKAGANINAGIGIEALWHSCDEKQKHLIDRAIMTELEKNHIKRRKEQILKARKLRNQIREIVSGTVIADKIAEDVISGKEKRTITPEVGAELRRKKAIEKLQEK